MKNVLLVEDEPLIRLMIAEMVSELGHRVAAEAGSVKSAKLLAETVGFDLAVLDINLGGRKHQLRRRRNHRDARIAVSVRERLQHDWLGGSIPGPRGCCEALCGGTAGSRDRRAFRRSAINFELLKSPILGVDGMTIDVPFATRTMVTVMPSPPLAL